MRLGCCAPVQTSAAMAGAGFDYLEVDAQEALMGDDPSEAWRGNFRQCALPPEVARRLIPDHHMIVGPARDPKSLDRYLSRIVRRAHEVGLTTLVFGSGKARSCTTEANQDRCHSQIVDFVSRLGFHCAGRGLVVCVEHLRPEESTSLNSLEAVRALVDEVAQPNVRIAVDTYHLATEPRPYEALRACAGRIGHVHVAEPAGRLFPGAHAEGAYAFDFAGFFSALRGTGYGGRVSFEGRWGTDMQAAAVTCVRTLRDAWARSSP